MGKVLGITKNNKDYKDIPDNLKWAIPIHEATETPEYKADCKRVREEAERMAKKIIARKRLNLQKP